MVFLGDYIDRGPDSARVLEWCAALLAAPPAWCEPVFLMGNHEQLLFAFLASRDEEILRVWLLNGGEETLASFGLAPSTVEELVPALTRAVARIGLSHWLPQVKSHHVAGPYLFVHAGIRPGVPLAEQADADLLWIREEFLNCTADHGYLVVHGHTPTDDFHADVRPNRVGIDTGCCMGGALTAVCLQDGVRGVFEQPNTIEPAS